MLNSKTMFEYDYIEKITTDHLACGKPNNSAECAVALFLVDMEEKPVIVDKDGAWYQDGYEEYDYTYYERGKKIASFGKKLRAFIRQFDKDHTQCTPQKIGIKIGPRGGVTMDIVD